MGWLSKLSGRNIPKEAAISATKKTKKIGEEPDYITSGSVMGIEDIEAEERRKERLRQLRGSNL